MLLCSSKSASQSFCHSELLPCVETKNYLISFKDVVSGVVSPSALVPKLFNPLPLHFPALFSCLGIGFKDPWKNTFCASVKNDLPDNPSSLEITTDPNGVFLASSTISLPIQPTITTTICAFPGNV
jgi:hypothetical protein